MGNIGNVSAININGNEMTIKDAAVREVVNKIISAIGANNSNIAERINNLHGRSFDYTLEITSNDESEIINIQDGIYKLHYVTVTGSGDNEIRTLNNSSILIQKENTQYLYKDGKILGRIKTNNSWGEWQLQETPHKLSSNYEMSSGENDELFLGGGDTYEEAFGKIEKAILDNGEIITNSLIELNSKINNVPIYNSSNKLSADFIENGETNKVINIKPNWNAAAGSDAEILNKPTIPAAVAVKGNAESSYRTGDVNITPANIGLGNVGNFKAVSTVVSQGLSDTEKANARENIGAGTSSFSGNYNDLSNKPTKTSEFINNGEGRDMVTHSTNTKSGPYTRDIESGVIINNQTVYPCTDLGDTNIYLSTDGWVESPSGIRAYTGVVYIGIKNLEKNALITFSHNNTPIENTYTNVYNAEIYSEETKKVTFRMITDGDFLVRMTYGKAYSAYITNITYYTNISRFVEYDEMTNYVNTNYLAKNNAAIVATSGSYNDLSDKPTIPMVPTNVSSFINDAGYITNIKNVTYSNLVTLKNNNNLVPGQQYRIIDYVTTTALAETQSAEHAFDIIITADSTNTINENARAIQRDGDTYFNNSKLESWEIKYCLDNDTDKFSWASKKITETTSFNFNEIGSSLSDKTVVSYSSETVSINDISCNIGINESEGLAFQGPTGWLWRSYGVLQNGLNSGTRTLGILNLHAGSIVTVRCDTGAIESYSNLTNNADGTYTVVSDGNIGFRITRAGALYEINISYTYGTEGKGVIYYMKDEFNNECGYDFKNIKYYVNSNYYYTFDVNGTDASLDNTNNVNNNIIYSYINNKIQYLNNNVFKTTSESSDWHDNIFKFNCYNNILGNNCFDNVFNNVCYNNTFGNYVGGNIFGNGFNNNTFGDNIWNNTFGNNCYSNTFSNCYDNYFGNSCNNNNFGNNFGGNTVNTESNNNTIANNCIQNVFGEGTNNIIFNKEYTQNIIIDSGNQYITLTTSEDTDSSNILRNINIKQGFNNSTTRKTITHATVNDDFLNIYQNNNSVIYNFS